jgi:hypothetical protein
MTKGASERQDDHDSDDGGDGGDEYERWLKSERAGEERTSDLVLTASE